MRIPRDDADTMISPSCLSFYYSSSLRTHLGSEKCELTSRFISMTRACSLSSGFCTSYLTLTVETSGTRRLQEQMSISISTVIRFVCHFFSFPWGNSPIIVVLDSIVLLHHLHLHGMACPMLEDFPGSHLRLFTLLIVRSFIQKGF